MLCQRSSNSPETANRYKTSGYQDDGVCTSDNEFKSVKSIDLKFFLEKFIVYDLLFPVI